jgi:hypothetical protein
VAKKENNWLVYALVAFGAIAVIGVVLLIMAAVALAAIGSNAPPSGGMAEEKAMSISFEKPAAFEAVTGMDAAMVKSSYANSLTNKSGVTLEEAGIDVDKDVAFYSHGSSLLAVTRIKNYSVIPLETVAVFSSGEGVNTTYLNGTLVVHGPADENGQVMEYAMLYCDNSLYYVAYVGTPSALGDAPRKTFESIKCNAAASN